MQHEIVSWGIDRVKGWQDQGRSVVHMVIKLKRPGNVPVQYFPQWLERRLLGFKRVMNTTSSGKQWWKAPDDKLVTGIYVFEEDDDDLHIHVILGLPVGIADPDAFLVRHLWRMFGDGVVPAIEPWMNDIGEPGTIARTKWQGHIWWRILNNNPDDRQRVVSYILKGITRPAQQYAFIRDWKLLERDRAA
jgi:hypothetical protein